MNKVDFFNGYQPIIQKALELDKNYINMPNARRATKSIELEQDRNKFFFKELKDELSGNKIDLLA